MKKIPLKRKKKQIEHVKHARITNETVAEHREKILAGGRKFKYPHQYVKHKLVINAILISLAVLILAMIAGWWQLYKTHDTSEFIYRVTRVLPLPVASVDGRAAQYSDYLMRYRSHELYLRRTGQIGLNASDDKKQLDFFKQRVLDGLEKDVYAEKLAANEGVSVTDKDVDKVIDAGRNTVTGRISQEVYDASTRDTFGYSPDEYRHIIRQSLLREAVTYKIDKDADAVQQKVAAAIKDLKANQSLEKVAADLKAQGEAVEYGASGPVSPNNQDGGLTTTSLKLEVGAVSSVTKAKSTAEERYYFYFLRRLPVATGKVSYEYIRVPLSTFDSMFNQLKKQNKITEYISI